MGAEADGSPGAGATALPERATEAGAAGADGADAASPSDSAITGSDAGGTDDDGGTGLTGTLDEP
jgi:hypothetical protein